LLVWQAELRSNGNTASSNVFLPVVFSYEFSCESSACVSEAFGSCKPH